MRPYLVGFRTKAINAAAYYEKTLDFIQKNGLSARVRETQLLQKKNAMKIICTIDVTFALETLPFVANILHDRSNDQAPISPQQFPNAAP